jgi:putative Mn2+ efflux pump MntP
MGFGEALLLSFSLCADCFASTLCAGVKLRRGGLQVLGIALVFSVIHVGFLLLGWEFGNVFVGFIERISHWIGFLLLLYVGGNMLLEGIRAVRGSCGYESGRLDGFTNVVLGAVATSIDALGVGVSQSMLETMRSFSSIYPLAVTLFCVTVAVVLAGLLGGRLIGQRVGHWAEIAGGLVLIGIGVSFLF